MNQKKTKQLRKLAKETAQQEQTSYTENFAYANGVKHTIKNSVRVDDKCIRGVYLKLKSKQQ